ncbi:MAG TPA: aldehyde ferredoxin oxidoreductase C-terminal domain-containing protein [Magnetovibrio sp.]
MRTYLTFDLNTHSVTSEDLSGEALARGGRYLIAKTLLEAGAATVDPLSPENPLIFSAGAFAGTNFSNANRLSVGCKSPLTGGIKEANAGGTFAFALGQLEIAGFTLNGASDDWVVIRIPKDGPVTFESAAPYMGKGNFEAARMLHEAYGDKVSIALCSPVGEYQGLIAGIAVSDVDNRPTRIAARGGVGAVMGSKKVKAIVVDKHKMPTFNDRKKLMSAVKQYGDMLVNDATVQNLSKLGTAMVGDMTNHMGALPVRNFSAGQAQPSGQGPFKMGGDFIREQNIERGGEPSHACMPGCQIKCSNVYFDKDGKELVSPVEYETLGLLGTNCGLSDPDDLAMLNAVANDLGIDTIEIGATLGVLMDVGQAPFGDIDFMAEALKDIGQGTERGRLLAQGTARVGAHFGAKNIPVIKKQAISAYDPRVIEVTGVSMMTTAQGADHTTGNNVTYPCAGKPIEDLVAASYTVQVYCAAQDSLGLCVFGRSVTNVNQALIVAALNDALGTALAPDFYEQMGRETLRLERDFNRAAGFTTDDNELPGFFLTDALPPTNKIGRLHAAAVTAEMDRLLDEA